MNKSVTKEASKSLLNLKARRTAAECMRLRGQLDEAKAMDGEVEAVDLALADLHPDDRYLLSEFFVERSCGFMQRLCEHFGCTESTVYRRKRRAVAEFAVRLFGSTE